MISEPDGETVEKAIKPRRKKKQKAHRIQVLEEPQHMPPFEAAGTLTGKLKAAF